MMNADLGEAMVHGPLFWAGARFISFSIWSNNAPRSRPSEFLSTLSVVRLQPCATDEVATVLPAKTEFLGVATRLHLPSVITLRRDRKPGG